MAIIGYARVSSVGQKLEVQLEKLKHCDKLFYEKESGYSGKQPQLKACLEYVREGDVLVVTRLSRLARSLHKLFEIKKELDRKGVDLQVLDQNIDTTTATGRLQFNIIGVFDQFETELRAEVQMDGIKKAKEMGVRFGRKRVLTPEEIEDMRQRRKNGALIGDIMRLFRLSKTSAYRYLKEDYPFGDSA